MLQVGFVACHHLFQVELHYAEDPSFKKKKNEASELWRESEIPARRLSLPLLRASHINKPLYDSQLGSPRVLNLAVTVYLYFSTFFNWKVKCMNT